MTIHQYLRLITGSFVLLGAPARGREGAKVNAQGGSGPRGRGPIISAGRSR
jgi:hypothetical protein